MIFRYLLLFQLDTSMLQLRAGGFNGTIPIEFPLEAELSWYLSILL
jgi:hypothetical protein